MIFLDTSGIYALADENDAYHEDALRRITAAVANGEKVVTHSYVIVESTALLQNRLSHDAALKFLHDVEAFKVFWVKEDLHHAAVHAFQHRQSTAVSFVDAVSFELMRQEGITRFIGYDRHFELAGFKRYRHSES